MRILALDLSTHAGWALLECDALPAEKCALLEHGVVELPSTAATMSPGYYPWNYYVAAKTIGTQVLELVLQHKPDVIVIEETNLGKQRYSQKILEWVHFDVLMVLWDHPGALDKVKYISTSQWRSFLGLRLSKDDKKANSKLSKAKSKAKKSGEKLDKKALGIKGRKNWKHLAVAFANETYGLDLKIKDNDVSDAICLGVAFSRGAAVCDGTGNFN